MPGDWPAFTHDGGNVVPLASIDEIRESANAIGRDRALINSAVGSAVAMYVQVFADAQHLSRIWDPECAPTDRPADEGLKQLTSMTKEKIWSMSRPIMMSSATNKVTVSALGLMVCARGGRLGTRFLP